MTKAPTVNRRGNIIGSREDFLGESCLDSMERLRAKAGAVRFWSMGKLEAFPQRLQ